MHLYATYRELLENVQFSSLFIVWDEKSNMISDTLKSHKVSHTHMLSIQIGEL